MNFQKYGSIINSYQQRSVQYVEQMGLADQPIWWVTEKIHGSNMGIWWDGSELKFSKRSSFIEGENFYGHLDVLNNDDIKRSMDSLQKQLNNPAYICVYGEICGNGVQSGIRYGDKKFLAFDVVVDGEYIDCEKFWGLNFGTIGTVPLISSLQTMEQAFDTNIEFDSKVLNEENNLCEGVVIKPNKYYDFGNGSRVIFKKKNDKFSEISSTKVKVKKELTPDAQAIFDELSPYITYNRFQNVLSKEGEFTPKQFGRFAGLLVKDAIEEWGKELNDKMINKELQQVANGVVREHMKKIS